MPTADKPVGLFCPTCGAALKRIVETREQHGGYYRFRKCANGHRVKTREVVTEASTHGGRRPGTGGYRRKTA